MDRIIRLSKRRRYYPCILHRQITQYVIRKPDHIETITIFPEFIICENGTENSLDFQLVTYLGSYTVKNPEDNLIIVSRDKGFDNVVHFWSDRGYNICRKAPSIFYTLSNEHVTEVFDSSDQCSDSHQITDTSENTEVTDAMIIHPYLTQYHKLNMIKNKLTLYFHV